MKNNKKEIWIVGTGRFGRLAVERLAQTQKHVHFVLIDPDNKKFELLEGIDCTLVQADGVTFLNENIILDKKKPDWIIPAVPVHLAAQWCLCRLGQGKIKQINLPIELNNYLPNSMRGDSGDIYVSHAEFLCPDDCPEPGKICTVTGKIRKKNMFELLAQINFQDFQSFVIRSHQLGPGVGGYRPDQLFDLLDQVSAAKNNMLISTACRCHGVVTGVMPLN